MKIRSIKRYLLSSSIVLIVSLSFFNCKSSSDFEYELESELNPFKISPLSAILKVKAEGPFKATITVLGELPIEHRFESISDSLNAPILGLYPNTKNKIAVSLTHNKGIENDTIEIQTQTLPDVFPEIEINKIDREKMEPGFHACDTHFANRGKFRSMPFIFDDQGKVRWYLDLSFHGTMVSPFQRLKDGTLLMVGRHDIYEFDMLGKIKKHSNIGRNYGMHHDVLELPDGKLLICVGKRNAFIDLDGEQVLSDSDFIILFDRATSQILKEWDLAEHLDVSRNDLNFFRKGDWLHMNGLAYDESDGSIIISAKNQGLIKLSLENDLKWILSPKKSWGKAGRDGKGSETIPYLLTAVDLDGKPFKNEVQIGLSSSEEFDFPWGPHAPKFLPNGNLLVFDNGPHRNFEDKIKFSRAVEYSINEEKKTVTQKWQYGKERGESFYSSIVSDADFLEKTGNILVTSGYLLPASNHSAKIVEVDYNSGKEVFEATLYLKTLNGKGTIAGWGETDVLYRSQRMELKY